MNKGNIAIEFAETVQALRQLSPTETETSITNIPVHRALEAHQQGKTLRHAQLIERLTKFRLNVEAEANIGIASLAAIETNLGLALADIALALGIHEPEDMLQILGPDTYLAVYWNPIPYQLAPQERFKQEEGAVPKLLTKLKDPTIRERFNELRARWHKKQTRPACSLPVGRQGQAGGQR